MIGSTMDDTPSEWPQVICAGEAGSHRRPAQRESRSVPNIGDPTPLGAGHSAIAAGGHASAVQR
ncbi:hypothetical protein [Rhodopseudomonas palustris]|uniref:hypothetical protein n=1 Tax=Rhodopseudomonas palustris TaxID=1076 RepID=UPI0005A18891